MNSQLRSFAMAGMMAATSLAPAAPDKVFVADEESNTVSILDAASFKRIAAVPVGREPHNVQVSPDGKLAWVTNNGLQAMRAMGKGGHAGMLDRGEVWAIDTESHAVVAKVPVGKHPAHVVLTPDGRFAYVTNGGENTVSVVEVVTRKVVATIAVGAYPHGIRVSPDGREAYVANLKGGSISVLDVKASKVVRNVQVGAGPNGISVTP